MQSKREAGIDLLRCVAAFLVVAFHGNLYVGYQSEPQTGVAMWAANSFYYLTVCCNGLFLMISGYLHSRRPWDRSYYSGLVTALVGYILASLISMPVRHFLLGQEKSLIQWIRAFFGFSGVYYGWFVEMYLGLMLLSPVINRGLEHMTDRQVLWTAVGMVFVTAGHLTDYWASGYPLAYYVLGAAVRRWRPAIQPSLCFLGAGGIAGGLGLVTLVSAGGGKLGDGYGQTFGGIWIMGMTLLLFLGLYRIRMGKRTAKWLRRMAEGTYGGYLLSHLLDAWVYRLVPGWHSPARYWLAVLFVTVPVFWASLGMGRLLHKMTESQDHRLSRWLALAL